MKYGDVDFSQLGDEDLFDLDLDPIEDELREEESDSVSDRKREQEYFKKMKAKWPQIKEALNLWGQKFSQGSAADRAIAAERIFEIFQTATLHYSEMASDSSVYRNAVATMRANFLGEADQPIRFLSSLCPEEVFYQALYKTLGWAMSQEDEEGNVRLLSGAYDHSKGASYVTWFSQTLKWTSGSRRRVLKKEHNKTNAIKRDSAAFMRADREANTIQARMAVNAAPRQQTRVLENLARLTAVALQMQKKLPLKAPKKSTNKHISLPYLQLFYSMQLVNFSRHAKDSVSRETDRVLLEPAKPDFLDYATTILPPHNYPNLVQAELSAFVLENGYYDLRDGEKELQDQAVAAYMNIGKNTLSKYFTTIKIYLCENRNQLA